MLNVYTKGSLHKTGLAKSSGVILSLLLGMQVIFPIQAHAYYNATATRTRITHGTHYENGHTQTYWQRHPKVKAAAIGGGVGLASGALVGGLTHHGIVRGAAIGAGTGAGVGMIRSSNTMRRHPIVKDTLTGSAIGLGTGWAAGRGGSNAFKGAAIGSAVGLGVGLLKNKNW